MGELTIHQDCKHYKGTIPCDPHKESGVHCESCDNYKPIDARILIIKLGAIGDVIRTTPLISAYKKKYVNPKFTWVTLTPSILPSSEIDEILNLSIETLLYIQNTKFDIAINLDKEKEACAILKQVDSEEKYGFILKDGETAAVNNLANHKLSTGLFDDLSKANKKSYCEEIFEICGLTFNGEKYLLDNHANLELNWKEINNTKKVIGLNTGCGDRWTTRLWDVTHWTNLAQELIKSGYEVILLGGEQEDNRNTIIAQKSGAKYLGYFALNKFINLVNQCDLVVTQVTMCMHLTIGLSKKIVLLNNIFNPYEFDLYNNGEILSPQKPCDCFYKGKCIHGTSCMETLDSGEVFKAIERNL